MHTTSKTLFIFVLLAASTALTLDTSNVSAASTHAHHHHIQLMNNFTNSTSIVGINGIMSGDGGTSTTQHGASNSHAHHHHGSANSIADINWYQLGN